MTQKPGKVLETTRCRCARERGVAAGTRGRLSRENRENKGRPHKTQSGKKFKQELRNA